MNHEKTAIFRVISMKTFTGKLRRKIKEKKTFPKIFFHEIPGGTSRNFQGIFQDLELLKQFHARDDISL